MTFPQMIVIALVLFIVSVAALDLALTDRANRRKDGE